MTRTYTYNHIPIKWSSRRLWCRERDSRNGQNMNAQHLAVSYAKRKLSRTFHMCLSTLMALEKKEKKDLNPLMYLLCQEQIKLWINHQQWLQISYITRIFYIADTKILTTYVYQPYFVVQNG